jgi:hypothetical protein
MVLVLTNIAYEKCMEFDEKELISADIMGAFGEK